MDPRDFGVRERPRKGSDTWAGVDKQIPSTEDTHKPAGTMPCLDILVRSTFISGGAGVRRRYRPTPEADP
jgi:hypothetical protein